MVGSAYFYDPNLEIKRVVSLVLFDAVIWPTDTCFRDNPKHVEAHKICENKLRI